MLELAHPWLLLLLPLPLLVRRFLPAYSESQVALQAPFFRQIAEATGQDPQPGSVVRRATRWQRLLAPAIWLLLVAAVTQPQWLEPPIVKELAGRDLMLLVDLSGSMETEDFVDAQGKRIDRLQAVKQVVGEFIERRDGDRIGLIVFGNAAFLQAPFTQDREVCRRLLEQTSTGMAGPKTMLGDAIGFAITRFEESESDQRVMLLLTDGNDTGSRMPPEKAADIAARHGITIHTIAVGDPEAAGEAKLDIEALQAISTKTNGRYFHAEDRAALESVYTTLDDLEPGLYDTLSYRPRRSLFHWPLGTAVLLVLLYHGVMALLSLRSQRAVAHA